MLQIIAEWAAVMIAATSALAGLFMFAMSKVIDNGLLQHEIRMIEKLDQRFVLRGEHEDLKSRVRRIESGD